MAELEADPKKRFSEAVNRYLRTDNLIQWVNSVSAIFPDQLPDTSFIEWVQNTHAEVINQKISMALLGINAEVPLMILSDPRASLLINSEAILNSVLTNLTEAKSDLKEFWVNLILNNPNTEKTILESPQFLKSLWAASVGTTAEDKLVSMILDKIDSSKDPSPEVLKLIQEIVEQYTQPGKPNSLSRQLTLEKARGLQTARSLNARLRQAELGLGGSEQSQTKLRGRSSSRTSITGVDIHHQHKKPVQEKPDQQNTPDDFHKGPRNL